MTFLTGFGDIIPRTYNGNCATHQRRVAKTIKRARTMGLFSNKHSAFTAISPFHKPDRSDPMYKPTSMEVRYPFSKLRFAFLTVRLACRDGHRNGNKRRKRERRKATLANKVFFNQASGPTVCLQLFKLCPCVVCSPPHSASSFAQEVLVVFGQRTKAWW